MNCSDVSRVTRIPECYFLLPMRIPGQYLQWTTQPPYISIPSRYAWSSSDIFNCRKQSHNTHMKVQGDRIYSSYSFTTSALDGVSRQHHSPAAPPGIGPPVPIIQEAGWASEPVWTQRLEEKSFCPCRVSNLYSPVAQPVARHCTDWASPAPICNYIAPVNSKELFYYFLFRLLRITCYIESKGRFTIIHELRRK
jgi:hypothetical protein